MKNLDLYKVIVLLSLVLLPAGYWYCLGIEDAIAASKKAIAEAKRPGGTLEQIGGLQKKVEVVVQNRLITSDATNQPSVYFDRQILSGAIGQGLSNTDFGIDPPRIDTAVIPGSKQRAADHVVAITWKRKDLFVRLSFLYAVLFNCESGARAGGGVTQSIWKLRELEFVNATNKLLLSGWRTPPPELQDSWEISRMSFARREPVK
jgi:hypothetical protein